MGDFLGFIFGLWFVGSMVSAPYFWAKKVDRSYAPIVRRFMAWGYGLGWPYFIFQFFAARKNAGQQRQGQEQARRDILDD